MEQVEYLIVALALYGAYLNARREVKGFFYWFAANALGVAFFINKHLYGMAVLYAIFAALNVYAIYRWRQDEV